MADARDLLIEIGCEELPPKALKRLSQAFFDGVLSGLADAGLSHGEAKAYNSPRRLAVLVSALDAGQSDRDQERRGPALQAAFDKEGNPSKAAEGFARSCRVTVAELQQLKTDKGEWLVHSSVVQGVDTPALIPDIVERALAQLPIPKRMRWGSSEVEFVRPVHWVVLLFGDAVIPGSALSVPAGRETRGHRFHHPDRITIAHAADYCELLREQGRVMVDFDERRDEIQRQVEAAAEAEGAQAIMDLALLDEVTALVEWPVAIIGAFEERFLEVPAEALISTMQGNQKYFPLTDEAGKLRPRFITIANIESSNPAMVRAGNERVIRPRLADAAFFWQQDRKSPLSARLEKLQHVVFQKKLGTLYDKAQRVSTLAGEITAILGGDEQAAIHAGLLSKCDLMTNMVGEFPELQGIMGRYYATADGEPDTVATALDEQYWPRFAGDRLPATPAGQALAIADKLDTLMGIFGIGQHPTGDKDPYALRRAALGVQRIVIEGELNLDLMALLKIAGNSYDGLFDVDTVSNQVFDYMLERLRAYYHEQEVSTYVFESVAARRPHYPLDFHKRVLAIKSFIEAPEAESLAAANKRIGNILRQAEVNGDVSFNQDQLVEAEEKHLATLLTALRRKVEPLIINRDYRKAMAELAGLKNPVDAFFDKVMVMAEDETLRHNRLALLSSMRDLFLRIADLSRLQA
jgi:glycyl-tRNA synthetase beta chain